MSDENQYQPVSILLVEDDDIDATGIMRAFKKMRMINPVMRARDGVEALDMLQNDKIDKPYIILLDLNMPRMNGLEFLHKIRQDEQLQSSIVFVLTTSNADRDKSEAYREHIAGFIVKSKLGTDFSELIDMLDHYWRLVELPVN